MMKHRTGIALLMACAFSSACTMWRTTSLEPQRFSSEKSPDQVRLTLSDGTRFKASHPVLVGDSLVWARRSVLASGVRQVEVRRLDAPRTVFALAVVGGLYALVHSAVESLGKIGGN